MVGFCLRVRNPSRTTQRRQLAPHDQVPPQALHTPPDQEPGAIQVVLTLVESLSEEMVEMPP